MSRSSRNQIDDRCYYFDIFKCSQQLSKSPVGGQDEGTAYCPTDEQFEDFLAPYLKQYNVKQSNLQKQGTGEFDDEDASTITMALECIKAFVVGRNSSDDDIDHKRRIFRTTAALEHLIRIHQRISYASEESSSSAGKSAVDESFDSSSSSSSSSSKLSSLIFEIYANLTSDGASETFKHDNFLPALPQIHRTMICFSHEAKIQKWGCQLLENLSNPLLQELVAAGSVAIVVNALQKHDTDKQIQHYGNATLYNLLPVTTNETLEHSYSLYFGNDIDDNSNDDDDVKDDKEKQPKSFAALCSIVLRGMENGDDDAAKRYGLMVLQRACQQDSQCFDSIVVEGGSGSGLQLVQNLLVSCAIQANDGAVVAATNNENDDETLAHVLCQFYRDMSFHFRKQPDFLKTIGGEMEADPGVTTLQVFLDLMQRYASSINIIDPAMAMLRNLALEETNRLQLLRHYPALIKLMDNHVKDAAIQAYGYDILGRVVVASHQLPKEEQTSLPVLFDSSLYQRSIRIMRQHRNHGGVQDRSIFWLLAVLGCEPEPPNKYKSLMKATVGDTTLLLELLKSAPASSMKQQAQIRLQKLIAIVEEFVDPGSFVASSGENENGGDDTNNNKSDTSVSSEEKKQDDADGGAEAMSRDRIAALLKKADKVEKRSSSSVHGGGSGAGGGGVGAPWQQLFGGQTPSPKAALASMGIYP